ncbi:hypothetical protein E2320_021627 [Naja naja]|nr:hypothetical protein E2320_021627 [Naja naja]
MAPESKPLSHPFHQKVMRFLLIHTQICCQWEPPPKWIKAAREATFIPTAVGLHRRESQGPEITDQIKILISEGIAAGLQQRHQAVAVAPETCLHQDHYMTSQHQSDLVTFQGSQPPPLCRAVYRSGDEDQKEMELSEDEAPDPPPAFAGLFCPALFKSLLFKAKATVHLGADPATTESALDLVNPSELLYRRVLLEQKDRVPAQEVYQFDAKMLNA